MPTVGIERIDVYPCTMALPMAALAEARGVDVSHPHDELMVRARAVNPPWEDTVTMAVNAARRVVAQVDPASIELVVVGTESSVDFGKPISTYVQRHTGLGPNVRNFETKHACYGGTSGLMMAAHWVASGMAPGKKALVVCTDQSRVHIGKPWEYVLGACATAMLVSSEPEVLELELDKNGYWTQEIFDTYRPTSKTEVGHAETSLYGYLDALEGSYEHFCQRHGPHDYDADFAAHVYHVPFGGMPFRGHRALLRKVGAAGGAAAIRESFARKTLPSIHYNALLGGTYTSATFVALMGLIERAEQLRAGDRLTMYSYGSGSCAEFYSAKLGRSARERVLAADLQARIDARVVLDVATYEAVETLRASFVDEADVTIADALADLPLVRAAWAQHYEGKTGAEDKLVLESVTGYQRNYRLASEGPLRLPAPRDAAAAE